MTVVLDDSTLMTRKEAAKFLSVSEGTLAVWHCEKRHDVPMIKVGRCCRYRRSELEAWLRARTVNAPVEATG